jgi:pimeloyl-ACP methyl ester carboxylesterase
MGTFAYAGKEIQFDFWSHLDGAAPPDTILFLGTAQNGRVPYWAAKAAPAGVVVVEGAPHWQAHPSAGDLYDFMAGYTRAAFEAVRQEFGWTAVHVIAHSQAVPGAVSLANELPQHVRNVALMAPLGFATSTFGDTPRARFKTLRRRGWRTMLQPSQRPWRDPRNLYVGLMVLHAIWAETERGASSRKYGAGLSYDILEDLRQLMRRQQQKGASLTVVFGGKDKIFPADEIVPQLERGGLNEVRRVILPGVSHLSLGARAGSQVVEAVVETVRAEP